MQSPCKIWRLERYARLTTTDQSSDDWEYFDNKDTSLELTLTPTNQLLLHHGKRQMESLFITDSKTWIKGVSKGDSLMLLIKIKGQSRRFRIKFSKEVNETGEECCRRCVEILSQHFQIKLPVAEDSSSQQVQLFEPSGTPITLSGQNQTVLNDDITLGQMAEALTNPSCIKLPAIYSSMSPETDTDLDTIIKLCLTDPTFPAFVEKVENHLEKIKLELH